MALKGYSALVKAQSSAIAITNEPTTSGDNKSYQITNAAKRILDFDTPLVVKDGGVPVMGYSISRINGTVTFPTSATRVITITGAYVTLATVAEASEFAFDGITETGDATVFSETNRKYLPTLNSATATITQFYDVDGFFLGVLFDRAIKVVELYADGGGDPFRFYALVSADSVTSSIDSLTIESITLQATNKMIVEA